MRSKITLIIGGILFSLLLLGCRQYHKLQKNLPVYSGARFNSVFTDDSNKQKKHELWTAEASIDDVSRFYQDELVDKKWKKEMIVPSPDGSGYALAYRKEVKMMIIIVYANAGKENETLIDLSIAPLPK